MIWSAACIRHPANQSREKRTTTTRAGLNAGALSAGRETVVESIDIKMALSINEAIDQIKNTQIKDQQDIVVIDKVDQIDQQKERRLLADLIKQIKDQEIPIKFLFCGVGDSLDELLVENHSCYRYLSAVKLERLKMQYCINIIDFSSNALGVNLDISTKYRIAAISDGFPHYVHLICQKLFYEKFEDSTQSNNISPENFVHAIANSVQSVEPTLRRMYDRATKKYHPVYEEVLWAVADAHELERRSTDIYNSYLTIMELRNKSPLNRQNFNARMNSLKQTSHGNVLIGTRAGWYRFRENILRGFVRLRAEEQGITLDREHALQSPVRRLD